MIPVIVFCSTFALVAAKSFQQKNVVANKWLAIPPMSYIMAYGELASIGIGAVDMATNGWEQIFVLGIASGTGGWIGCWLGMILHNRIFRNKTGTNPQ